MKPLRIQGIPGTKHIVKIITKLAGRGRTYYNKINEQI